jgi:HAE1 family hydrophobic/amphiphilic exporter-1
MTSFAFILGMLPMATATGAGAASQQALGTVVVGGMLASSLLAIPFVPVFYILMQRISERRAEKAKPEAPPPLPPPAPARAREKAAE